MPINLVSVLVSMVLGGSSFKQADLPPYPTQEPRYDDISYILSTVKLGRTRAILEDLIKCESGGNPNAINPKDHGSPSYGLLQWKEDSFWRYNKKYGFVPTLERHEVINIIYDQTAQIKIAEKVIDDGGIGNWYNCASKYGYID